MHAVINSVQVTHAGFFSLYFTNMKKREMLSLIVLNVIFDLWLDVKNLVRFHPVINRVAIKDNFTEKAMADFKSLGKRLQE